VHQMGMPCNLEKILKIAGKHSLQVVEDAACAAGSEIKLDSRWEKIGRPRGDIACFSFHPRKLLTTGDGGMLTTNNPEYDRKFRLWRQHSMSVPDTVRHAASSIIFEEYPEIGYNYRLTDIQAAVGRIQLKRLPEIIAHRRTQADGYRRLLSGIPGLTTPTEPEWAQSNWQSYCVRLPEGSDQQTVMQEMLNLGIATRRGVMCAHREPAYRHETWSCGEGPSLCGCPQGTCRHLTESEGAQDGCIILPLFHTMTDKEQATVADALKRCCSV